VIEVDFDPKSPCRVNEHRDQVRIEPFEGARAAMNDVHLRPRPPDDVRELERDVAASDEHDPLRKRLQFEKRGAVDEALRLGSEVWLAWLRTR
jgi:hypothetical protein